MAKKDNNSELRTAILRKRYFLKDAQGEVIENEEQMLHRVANAVALAECKDKGIKTNETNC